MQLFLRVGEAACTRLGRFLDRSGCRAWWRHDVFVNGERPGASATEDGESCTKNLAGGDAGVRRRFMQPPGSGPRDLPGGAEFVAAGRPACAGFKPAGSRWPRGRRPQRPPVRRAWGQWPPKVLISLLLGRPFILLEKQ